MIRARAAVAWAAGEPLEVTEIEVAPPQAGEVLLKVVATGVCHTDAYTLSGADPEGLFPAVLGHEGGAVVVEVGEGVSSVSAGDHVIPLYTPECGRCRFCRSGKTNLCQAIRTTQGRGLMPDGTSRFSKNGRMIHHYMGTSTFSEYTVLPEIAVARIKQRHGLHKRRLHIRPWRPRHPSDLAKGGDHGHVARRHDEHGLNEQDQQTESHSQNEAQAGAGSAGIDGTERCLHLVSAGAPG